LISFSEILTGSLLNGDARYCIEHGYLHTRQHECFNERAEHW
jgi:hypothetical protein